MPYEHAVCVRPLLVTAASRKSVACVMRCVYRSRQTRKKRTSLPPSFQQKRAAHTSHERTGTDRPLLLLLLLHTSLHSPLQVFPRTINTRFFFLQQPGEEKGKPPPLNPHLVHFSGAQVQSYIVGPQKQQWLGLGRTDFQQPRIEGGNKFARTYVVSRSAGPPPSIQNLPSRCSLKGDSPPVGLPPSAFSLSSAQTHSGIRSSSSSSAHLSFLSFPLHTCPPPLLVDPSAAAREEGFFCSPPLLSGDPTCPF